LGEVKRPVGEIDRGQGQAVAWRGLRRVEAVQQVLDDVADGGDGIGVHDHVG
jgi:hypothetical protein